MMFMSAATLKNIMQEFRRDVLMANVHSLFVQFFMQHQMMYSLEEDCSVFEDQRLHTNNESLSLSVVYPGHHERMKRKTEVTSEPF